MRYMHNSRPTKKPQRAFVILKDTFLSRFVILEIAIRPATIHEASAFFSEAIQFLYTGIYKSSQI